MNISFLAALFTLVVAESRLSCDGLDMAFPGGIVGIEVYAYVYAYDGAECIPMCVQLMRSVDVWMGIPGKNWKLELTM